MRTILWSSQRDEFMSWIVDEYEIQQRISLWFVSFKEWW
jgi:hypothetical protein